MKPMACVTAARARRHGGIRSVSVAVRPVRGLMPTGASSRHVTSVPLSWPGFRSGFPVPRGGAGRRATDGLPVVLRGILMVAAALTPIVLCPGLPPPLNRLW